MSSKRQLRTLVSKSLIINYLFGDGAKMTMIAPFILIVLMSCLFLASSAGGASSKTRREEEVQSNAWFQSFHMYSSNVAEVVDHNAKVTTMMNKNLLSLPDSCRH